MGPERAIAGEYAAGAHDDERTTDLDGEAGRCGDCGPEGGAGCGAGAGGNAGDPD